MSGLPAHAEIVIAGGGIAGVSVAHHLPEVHLADVPGFMIGPDAEKEGTIRAGMRA